MSSSTVPLAGSPTKNPISVNHYMRPLQRFLEDPAVTEIAVVRAGEVYALQRSGWQCHECAELTYEHLESLATALAVYNGFGTKTPILSVRLPGGERGQLVRPPACLDGTFSLNVRKHTTIVKSLEELAQEGAFSQWRDVGHLDPSEGKTAELSSEDQELLGLKASGDVTRFLEAAMAYRRNILISGGTGSGKTTIARSIIELVPPETRVVTMEDTHELLLPHHPNRVHMLYVKNPGPGDVTAAMCVEAAMRMTPDRIFLAELRGDETWEYLQALNTGHPGSVSTTHANSAREAFSRLAMLIKSSESGRQLDLATIQTYLYGTVHVVLAYEKYRLKELYFDPAYAKSRLNN